MKRYLAQGLLILAAFLLRAESAQAQSPCQWNYAFVAGVATATYCGNVSWAGLPVGTVTSVGLSAPPDLFTVGGSPVTSTGTLALTEIVQLANTVWAGPTTGTSATPGFRALVPADIPSLSATYLPLAGGALTGAVTSASTLTLGGASIGSNTLAVTGSVSVSTTITATGSIVTSGGNISLAGNESLIFTGMTSVTAPGTGELKFPSWIATAAPPTVAAAQIGYGSTIAASSNCGSLVGETACIVVNVAGTVHYIPYY